MKNYLLLAVVVLLSVAGCKKVDKLTMFEMDFTDSVVIESSTGINLPFNILMPSIETNSESTFEVNDTNKDLIEEIVLTSLVLDITSPSGEDFSFLNRIDVYINASGQEEVKIAWKENVSPDVTSLILDVTGVDLQEYIKADEFSLRLNTETDELLATDHHIDVRTKFFVDAKILGL